MSKIKAIPSEAVISLHKYQGNNPLHDVQYQAGGGFELRISEAKKYDSFGEKKIIEGRQYVSINMSYTQFVEMITLNSITPVTMEQFDDYEILPLKNTKNAIEEVTDYSLLSQIEELKEIRKSALEHAEKPNKTTKNDLLNKIDNFEKNRNFYERKIKEITAIQKIKALSEIENSMIAKFAEIGKNIIGKVLIEKEELQLQLPFSEVVKGENK